MLRAIVVDDEPITRLDLAQMLEELDCTVVGSVADGFDAVDLCEHTHPDIALMDVNMPLFDGLGAAEKIISNKLAGCVIIISGYSDRANITRAAQAGVAGWIVKPVEKQQLLPVLEIALADATRVAKLREENTRLEQKLLDIKLVDRAKAILAEQRRITEKEAHRQIQMLAMEKRCSMIAIAKRIVESGSDRETVNKAKDQLMRERGMSEPAAYKTLTVMAEAKGVPLVSAARDILAEKMG
ncbi:MAG: ANTAR domain-containing protein [Clostridiaceae bacterium]